VGLVAGKIHSPSGAYRAISFQSTVILWTKSDYRRK